MSLEGFRPISNDRLGSLLSRIRAEAVPFESAPLAKNIRFKARGVQTRNGLSLTTQLPSNFKVKGAGVLAQPSENPPLQIPLYLGSDASSSALYREAMAGGGLSGSVTPIVTGLIANLYMDMATAYNRAFLAYGDQLIGLSDPKQYDGTNYDPISLDPQSSTCTLSQGAAGGNVEAGVRYAVVLFKNRHGYITGVTSAAVSSYTGADGIHKVHVASIPVSAEPSVTSRIVCFTVAGADQAGPYFYIPEDDVVGSIAITKTVIEDNVTTAVDFNFTDVYLQGSTDITSPQDFFDKIKLPKQANVYFSPSTKRLIWTGGEDDATIFRVSEPDDPETYMGSTGFVKPSQNDGERAICSREFRSQLYLFKETAGFLTYNDAANPSDWTVEKRWDRVGPVGPWAVDTSESFMIILDQSGVYKMDGSIPICISDEISSVDSRIWSRINFQVREKFWVFIDTDLDEVHVGVALDGSTEVNRILKCNYLLGFSPGSRKWSIDTIPSTRMLRIQRNLPVCPNPNQMIDPRIATQQIIHLSANNDGSINLVDPASFLDNGNAIDSKYQTGYYEEEGVLQIGGIGLNARGSGDIQVSVLKNQTQRKTITRQLPQEGALMGEVVKTNGQNPWWALEFSNNNVAGSWFEVTRCDLYVRTLYKTRRTRATGGSSQSSFSLDSESDSEVDGVSFTNPQLPDEESDCNCDDLPLLLSGLHADRPLAVDQIENTEYIETDRGNAKYYVRYLTPCEPLTAVWELVVGKMQGTIVGPDQKPSDLGVYDVGFEFESTDFSRVFEWSGSVWRDLFGQTPRSVQQLISTPSETGWQLCDGSTGVVISTPQGATTLFDVPDLLDRYPKYGSTYTGIPVAANSPSASATLPTHTHNVTATGSISGSTASNGAHTHTVTALGGVTGDLPDHPHGLVAGDALTQSPLNISDNAPWVVSGTVASHTHSFTPAGGVTGDMPDHEHLSDEDLLTGGARLGDGSTPWGVASDFTTEVSGTADVSGTTDNTDLTHTHGATLTGTAFENSIDVTTADEGFVSVSTADHEHEVTVNGITDNALGEHSHGFTGSGSISAIASTSVVNDHLHPIGELLSGPVVDDPIALTLTFTGTPGTTGSNGPAFSSTTVAHYHEVTGHTDGIGDEDDPGPFPLDLTFTGTSATTSSDGAHTHGVGTLVFTGSSTASGGVNGLPIAVTVTVGSNGEPDHLVLLPYFKL